MDNEEPSDGGGREYLGIARIDLATVSFDHALELGHREPEPKKIERLLNVFRTEGCKRLDCSHFSKVTVDNTHLSNALRIQKARLPHQPPIKWDDVPSLDLPRVTCLNGLHRVEAAHLPKGPKQQIVDEYQNEQPFTDGEIFRKIRLNHNAGNEYLERQWWARLSSSKAKELKRSLKDVNFVKVFDQMIPWPGLWQNMQICSLRRMTRLKCDEELVRYLEAITSTWLSILDGTGENFDGTAVDAVTVHRLEALYPKVSSKDAEVVESLFRTITVFPKVRNLEIRDTLRHHIAKCRIILSMYTFSENLKYLEPCAKSLRHLLPPDTKRSIHSLFCATYQRPDRLQIEYGEADIRSHPQVSSDLERKIGYQQLWLFALRNFSALSKVAPKSNCSRRTASSGSDPLIWRKVAALALSLDFRTASAKQLVAQSAEYDLASQLVSNARIQEDCVTSATQRIATILRSSPKIHSAMTSISASGGTCLTREQRCGRPFEDDHSRDRLGLYLPSLCRDSDMTVQYISTFYCKSIMFSIFFDLARNPLSALNATLLEKAPPLSSSVLPDDLNCEMCKSLGDSLASKTDLIETLTQKSIRLEGELGETQNRLEHAESASQNTIRDLEVKLAAVESEYQRLKSCQIKDLERSRRDAGVLEKAQMVRDSQNNEIQEPVKKAQVTEDRIATLQASNTRLQSELSQAQAINDQTATLQASNTKLQSELSQAQTIKDRIATLQASNTKLHSELNQAQATKGQVATLQASNTKLQSQLSQAQAGADSCIVRMKELESDRDNLTSSLVEKENIVQKTRRDLETARAGLEAATSKIREFKASSVKDRALIKKLRQQIKAQNKRDEEELTAMDGANERLYDTETARMNDQAQFERERAELMTQATDAITKAQENADLLKETFEQILRETNEYHLQLSTQPTSDFLLLRIVDFKEGAVFLRDKFLTFEAGDETIQWLNLDSQPMDSLVLLIGMDRKRLVKTDTTFDSLQRSWRARQVLWAIPVTAYAQVKKVWSEEQWNGMDQLEKNGFRRSPTNGKLQYVGNESGLIKPPPPHSSEEHSTSEKNLQLTKQDRPYRLIEPPP